MTQYEPTHDLNTNENALIGSLVMRPESLAEVIGIVEAGDIQDRMCRAAWAAIVKLYETNEIIDPVTIADEMIKAGTPNDDRETLVFIRDVMLARPSAEGTAYYAKGVANQSKLRKIDILWRDSVEQHTDHGELIGALMDGLHQIGRGEGKPKIITMPEALKEVIKQMTSEETGKLDTGVNGLDALLNGIYPGQLILIAARPAVGKSAFAAQLAMEAASKGTETVLFSVEMTVTELTQRFMASVGRVRLDSIINREVLTNESDYKRISNAYDKITDYKLWLCDDPGITLTGIRRTLQTKKDTKLAIVDYIQIMRSEGRQRDNRNLEVADISSGLKAIAKEFQIPIIALSQLSRSRDEYEEPGLTALRDSGALEQDADKVIMLWRLGEPEGDELQLIGAKVAKNRMGKTGIVTMRFNGEHMTFRETAEKYTRKKRQSGYYQTDSGEPY